MCRGIGEVQFTRFLIFKYGTLAGIVFQLGTLDKVPKLYLLKFQYVYAQLNEKRMTCQAEASVNFLLIWCHFPGLGFK